MELYRERGFDQTTTAEIAARAGVNERTFFRHFPTSARCSSTAKPTSAPR
ncbi:helix-turn-helix domain-containing protein [Streptomyces lydicus]